jgi:hypothetical protein
MGDWPQQSVKHFHGRALPEPAVPAGNATLIDRFDLAVPLPPRLTAIAERHHPTSNASWRLLTPRHRPTDTLEGQLVFGLKWEGLALGILATLFKAVEPNEIAAIVRTTPTGAFARRIWFLYEWLTDRELDVPDPGKVRVVSVVDPEQQVALQRGSQTQFLRSTVPNTASGRQDDQRTPEPRLPCRTEPTCPRRVSGLFSTLADLSPPSPACARWPLK